METKTKINFRCGYIILLEDLEVNGYIVPKGFKTDGATIPKIFWTLFGSPLNGKYVKSAILHDYLYDKNCVYRTSFTEANKIFLDSMKKDGVNFFKRNILYLVVSIFGYFFYHKKKKWC